MKMMSNDNFKFIAESHKAFMALAKEYMDSCIANDDFAGYGEHAETAESYEEDCEMPESDDFMSASMDWSDVGSDPYAWAPHFDEQTIGMVGLDHMAGGVELGLPKNGYVNYTPRGIPDHLLIIRNGKFIE